MDKDELNRKVNMTVEEMAKEVIKNNNNLEPSTFLGVIERAVEKEFPEDVFFHIYEKFITTKNPKYIANIILEIKKILMEAEKEAK